MLKEWGTVCLSHALFIGLGNRPHVAFLTTKALSQQSFEQFIQMWEQNPTFVFADSLIEQFENELNIHKEKVLEELNRSVK